MTSTVETVKNVVSNKTILLRRAAIVTGIAVAFGVGILVQKARHAETNVHIDNADVFIDSTSEDTTNPAL